MLNGIFDNLLYWHWWLFAIALIIVEVFSAGAFFIWMGVAAIITGFVLLVMPEISWQTQFILFAVSSIVAILAGRSFFNRKEINTEDPTLSSQESSLIGKSYTVEQAIINGSGRVKVGESTWKASGPDCKAGSSVKVIAVDGAELIVELI
jgi:membrane protein implicated in regulation of membrane protease activity